MNIEIELVIRAFGWRVRFYLGHTAKLRRRIRAWRSDLGTRGIFIVPWGTRVIGAQWRRLDLIDPDPTN